MTKGLSESQVRWVTYLLYIVLVVEGAIIGWHTVQLFELPREFVRLERYTEDKEATAERYSCDMARIERALDSINSKLDTKLIYNVPKEWR